MMAPECLRELSGLSVTDPMCDLADRESAARQELAGALHAHRRQMLPERGVPDLGVRALQLPARGRDATRDVVERQVRAELGLDDRRRILEEGGAMSDGGGSLDWHLFLVRRPDVR